MEWAEVFEATVGFMKLKESWTISAGPTAFLPSGVETPPELGRLIRAVAARCAPQRPESHFLHAHNGNPEGEVVIKARVSPRASFHLIDWRYEQFTIRGPENDNLNEIIDALRRLGIRHAACAYDYDGGGVRFTNGPESLPGLIELPRTQTEATRLLIQERLAELTWSDGFHWAGGSLWIDGYRNQARLSHRTQIRGEPILTFN